MKRIFVSIIAVLSAVVFTSCSLVTNNYYQQNESAASSETAVNTVPAANSETAKETQPVKEDNAASAVSAADAPQSIPNENEAAFHYDTPFYGIWVYASKSSNEATSFANDVSLSGFNGYTENTIHWSNLNDEEWYVVTAGKYSTENEANNHLSAVKKKYPDAYVKYSGEYNITVSNSSYSAFYGIWVYASKSYDEASSFAGEVSSNGFNGYTENTTHWSNLNDEEWNVVTAGKYATETEAVNQLSKVKEKYPDAYVKYSGEYQLTSGDGDPAFYGIWVYASKSYDEAASFAGDVSSTGLNGVVIVTTDWSNLNSEKWYVVTAGQYETENEANDKLNEVQAYYPDAYVKYSGNHINN